MSYESRLIRRVFLLEKLAIQQEQEIVALRAIYEREKAWSRERDRVDRGELELDDIRISTHRKSPQLEDGSGLLPNGLLRKRKA